MYKRQPIYFSISMPMLLPSFLTEAYSCLLYTSTCGGDPQGKTGSAKNGCIIARQTGHPVCREVINMENIGVTCDVCACCHNVAGCKCDLPQIKVTEQCTCNTQQEGTPHYCQNYEEK